jgi:putative hemin transport protein
MTPITVSEEKDLKTRWAEFKADNPHVRIREAAENLGVSEVELLATDCGESVTRLEPKCAELLQEFDRLGKIMALTRNDEIVHERKGEYKNVEIMKGHRKMGLAVNEDIDLRIFFDNWHSAFAVESDSPRGKMHSFQFFDIDGSAIHKVYLSLDNDLIAYKEIVEKYKSSDQSTTQKVEAKPAKKAETADAEIDLEGFRAAWGELKDTHDFFPMLMKFKVGREQALRLADAEMAQEVDAKSFRFVLEEASKRELPLMIFVGNAGIIQIHTGEVKKVLDARGWFNVMDPDFNLHIDQDKIARAWIVKKPTEDGIVTSLELFNSKGENVALFFGKRKPGIPESESWRKLISDLQAAEKSV